MLKLRYLISVTFLISLLSGCVSNVWTGANLVYDRHSVYKKFNDYHLFVAVNDVLAKDRIYRNSQCSLDIAAFNGDILVAGHVPNEQLFEELRHRLALVKDYRRLYNFVTLNSSYSSSVTDSWITTKLRSQIFADQSIDPNAFKIITSDGVVYLMGDVQVDEAEKVVQIARSTRGVVQVVKLLKYFTYQNSTPSKNMR
jgi:osmotically-inducible protein OsmY